MKYILFDDSRREHLLPLTYTRPVSMIRVGILTIKEKWDIALATSCYHLTTEYLQKKFPQPAEDGSCLLINGGVFPTDELTKAIHSLSPNQALISSGTLLAIKLESNPDADFSFKIETHPDLVTFGGQVVEIFHPWDIFSLNGIAIELDFKMLTKGKKSQLISPTNKVLNPENIFIEEGASVECATLNANTGPIYIGKDAEVMEGSLIRGPFALCDHSTLKLGAKIYGPTTIGPHCKVGGEVNNSVIFGYTNKAHDGFLGNSVIGEWCNLGADTNNSNLKNNYAEVKLWCYAKKSFVNTGLQFCGLVMGDHSKCGINTMFNTGTVVGVSANIFGDGFPRNFIPSFSWGGAQGFSIYKIDKALETAQKVMERRNIELDNTEKEILTKIFELSEGYRKH
ncbi:MAG TPA: GlmU family protein [Tenuifilaceae bacterium]|nr:GlmU family protein [Tenuifilaceae bacterium]HRX67369.1 GlmU family protein [Tenuifilaceae bacterium]